MNLFIPGFFFVFHLCIISQLCSLKVCLVACWSITLRSRTRITLCRTGFKVMSCAKKYLSKPKMIQGYMVAPYTIPCSYSFVMDEVHDKYVYVWQMCSRTMVTCLIGRRFVLDKCLPRSHGDSAICPLFVSLNTFPNNRDLHVPTTTTNTMMICRSVFYRHVT